MIIDDLLRELRAALADPEQQGTRLWFAARDLDDRMSAYGILPRPWVVSVPDAISVDPKLMGRARDKMREVVRAAVATMPGMDEAAPSLVDEVARVAAQAVVSAALEEQQQQAALMERYMSAHIEREMLHDLRKPSGVVVEPGGSFRPMTEQERWARAGSQCTVGGSHGGHRLGHGLYCSGHE